MKQTKKTYKIDKKALAEIESLGGAFAKNQTKDWKEEKAEYLEQKSDAQIKLDRLKSLIGVWDNEDGEKIADVISKIREIVNEREITPLD